MLTIFGAIALLIGASLAPLRADDSGVRIASDTPYTHPQRMVDIGAGRKMNLYCTGSGSPTVIFDSGLNTWSFEWVYVQPEIAKKTRVCSYDRAGLGYSDPSDQPRTAANIVADLQLLLHRAEISPPYVLVGHSFGGMTLRLFADLYHSEVSGMVFVDPGHEDQRARFDAINDGLNSKGNEEYVVVLRDCVKEARRGFSPGSDLFKRCIDPANPHLSSDLNSARVAVALRPAYQAAVLSERENFQISADEIRKAQRPYGAMPLIVLTAPALGGQNLTVEKQIAYSNAWTAMHDDIAALSTIGVHRVYPDSTHDMTVESQDIVIGAINDVLATLKGNR